MAKIEYLVRLAVDGPIDPDDQRPAREQADEWVDGLLDWIADSSGAAVWAELLDAHQCDDVASATASRSGDGLVGG